MGSTDSRSAILPKPASSIILAVMGSKVLKIQVLGRGKR